MQVSSIKQLPFKSSSPSAEQLTSTKYTQKTKNREKMIPYALCGVVGVGTLLLFSRTSRTRIEKIIANITSNSSKNSNSSVKQPIIQVQNFTNNSNVVSIDDLSGLNEVKKFANKLDILYRNKDIQNEHVVTSFSSILLWGLPGTGKTSVAKGIAKKLDADFVRIDKDSFDSAFVSEGPRHLKDYIDQIKNHSKNNPNKKIVVFMDEIDGTISVDNGYNNRHSEDLLNVIKQGITDLQEDCKNVIFIGATNKDPSGIKSDNVSVKLNSAILSRFNYQFELGLPDKKSIQDAWIKLIKTQSGKEKFTKEQNEQIAKAFEQLGMSYRDIKNIANKLNIEDAVEFCNTKSYNSKTNLLNVLSIDEKIGYDSVKRQSITKEKKQEIIEKLKKSITD